jgi:hypothetical protein
LADAVEPFAMVAGRIGDDGNIIEVELWRKQAPDDLEDL